MRFDGVRITLDDRPIVDIASHIAPGQILSIMGPSGSGKSTLLAAAMGTLAPAFQMQGRIALNGRDVTDLPPEERKIGILFQDALLFPHLSVGANLAFGLTQKIKGRTLRRDAVKGALEEVGLGGFADRDPATLSGGQKTRAALMRTLLADPEALLLDEPFSSLDTALRDQVRELVFTRARAANLPVVLVTHDRQDAIAADGPILEIGQADRTG